MKCLEIRKYFLLKSETFQTQQLAFIERKILFHLTSLGNRADMVALCKIRVLSWWVHAFFHSPFHLRLPSFVLQQVSEQQLVFLGCLSGTSVDIGSLDLIFDFKPILNPLKT